MVEEGKKVKSLPLAFYLSLLVCQKLSLVSKNLFHTIKVIFNVFFFILRLIFCIYLCMHVCIEAGKKRGKRQENEHKCY